MKRMATDRDTRIRRPSDMGTVAATARYLGKLLATPCTCGRSACTVGEHAFHATRDTEPGIKAQAFDGARVSGTRHSETSHPETPTTSDHAELTRLAASINLNCIALAMMIAAHQHDRQLPAAGDSRSGEDWCRHHLDTIGSFDPRHRGDLCKWCYEFQAAYRMLPPKEILGIRHSGGRITQKMIAEAKAEAAAAKRARKRKQRKQRK